MPRVEIKKIRGKKGPYYVVYIVFKSPSGRRHFEMAGRARTRGEALAKKRILQKRLRR